MLQRISDEFAVCRMQTETLRERGSERANDRVEVCAQNRDRVLISVFSICLPKLKWIICLPMIFQWHSPFVCNSELFQHSGLFAVTSRDDFWSIYFAGKEIAIRHPQKMEREKRRKKEPNKSFCFIWHDNVDNKDIYKFISLFVRIVVWFGCAAQRCRLPNRMRWQNQTNRSSSNNTNYIRYAGKTIGSILFCLHPLRRCVRACPKPNSLRSAAAAVVHEFPFKPKIYLVFLYVVWLFAYTMLIQLWCSNVRPVKWYRRIARKKESGVCLWSLLHSFHLLCLCVCFFLFFCLVHDSNGMENKISHFGCFMWMYVSLCLLFSREKKNFFDYSSLGVSFVLALLLPTSCDKMYKNKWEKTHTHTNKMPNHRKMENGFVTAVATAAAAARLTFVGYKTIRSLSNRLG